MMKKALIPAFLLLTISCLTGLTGCRKQSQAPGSKGDNKGKAAARGGEGSSLPARAVHLVVAQERSLPRLVTAPGTLAADQTTGFSFKVAGRLEKLNVDLGSIVRQGQVIAQIEPTDFQTRVQQAEAALQQARVRIGLPPQASEDPNDDRIEIENTALVRQARAVLEEARQNHQRAVRLVSEGVQPQAELDRTEAALKVAESRYQDAMEEVRNRQGVLAQRRSELELARQQLAYTILRAPSSGSVLERRAQVGEFVAGGTPVVTVVRTHPLRLRIEIPEREANGIRAGLPVRVTVEGDENHYTGRVVRLSPAIAEQSRTLIVEAEVDNQHGRLRPGAFARAEIQTSTSQGVVTVPPSAIVNFAGIQKVFLVKDGKAVEQQVIPGKRDGDWVEITDGLKPGDAVVETPGNLVAGQPVTIEK